METRSNLADIKTLHYYFLNLESGECIERVQQSTFLHFGMLVDTLNVAVYDCIVIGHSGEANESGKGIINFEKVTENFRGTESFETERGREIRLNITLDRINSRIEIVSKEKLPEDAGLTILKLTNVSNTLNIIDGYPIGQEEVARTFNLRESDIGKENITFAINCFSCEGEESILTITTTNKKGEVLRHIETEPFQIKQNIISRFTGYLFTVFGIPDIGININQGWEETEEYEIKDLSFIFPTCRYTCRELYF